MAYGFNDDKSITEIYSKADFAIVTGTVSSVPESNCKMKYITPADLLAAGVENPSDWTVLSVMQRRSGSAYRISTHYIYTNDNDVYPFVQLFNNGSNPAMAVSVYNNGSVTDIDYEIVLMKVR